MLPIGLTSSESSAGSGSGCSPSFAIALVKRMRQSVASRSQPCCRHLPSTARDGRMPFLPCLAWLLPSGWPSSQNLTDSRAQLDHRSMDIGRSCNSNFHSRTSSRSPVCQQDPWLPACHALGPLESGPWSSASLRTHSTGGRM